MKNIFITGISGTGKTTIASELQRKGIRTISLDEIPGLCFWIDKKERIRVEHEVVLDRVFIDTHSWICDIDKLKELLDTKENTVVLGHVGNQNDFLHVFNKVILLTCRPDTFIARILSRQDNDFGKDKTAQEFLLDTYKEFEQTLIDKGAIIISTEGSLDEVFERIMLEIRE